MQEDRPQRFIPLPTCFFATDLHGDWDRYEKLLISIEREQPNAVFLGGDLLPPSMLSLSRENPDQSDFMTDCLIPALTKTRLLLRSEYPDIFLVLGNDDPRWEEERFQAASAQVPGTMSMAGSSR